MKITKESPVKSISNSREDEFDLTLKAVQSDDKVLRLRAGSDLLCIGGGVTISVSAVILC